MRTALIASLIVSACAAVELRIRVGGKTESVELEAYVAAVIAAESGGFRSNEALKAMAVAARTYAVGLRNRHATDGYDLCATTHCQLLDGRSVTGRFVQAAEDTAGEMLWFEGRPAFTTYSRNCGGRSEPGDMPYLKMHDDPYCPREPWQWTTGAAELRDALLKAGFKVPRIIERIAVAARTASGRVRTLSVLGGGESAALSASSMRFAAGRTLGWSTLRSDRWNVGTAGAGFAFEGNGAGHGVGLCQLGAERMGTDGHSYRQILDFYYEGARLGLTASGLRWTRLEGESVTLLTARPDRDRRLVSEVERLRKSIEIQGGVEVRVYPDVETFRNATGEPGWVAAYSTGHRIHTQPAPTASTLRHELLHIMVEDRAAPGTPLWFREGIVEVLARERHTPGSSASDFDIRQRESRQRAQAAYGTSAKRVAGLVSRYGEPAVLGWLRGGLPEEVKNSRVRNPATKSR